MTTIDEKHIGFSKLSKEVGSPALAAWIGRKKYGKEKFDKASHDHEKLKDSEKLKESFNLTELADELYEMSFKVKKGAFHRWLGKPEDEPITNADIEKGLKAGGHAAKMANFARNVREWYEESIEYLDETRKKIGEYSHGNNTTKVFKLTGQHYEGDPYHVKLFKDGKHYEPADYFTNDEEDAHGTAKHMVKEHNIIKHSGKYGQSYTNSEPEYDEIGDNDDIHGHAKVTQSYKGRELDKAMGHGRPKHEYSEKESKQIASGSLKKQGIKGIHRHVAKEDVEFLTFKEGVMHHFIIVDDEENIVAEGFAPTETGVIKQAERLIESVTFDVDSLVESEKSAVEIAKFIARNR